MIRCTALATRKISNVGSSDLLSSLRMLDTACLCDADKSIASTCHDSVYQPISLLEGLRPLMSGNTMAGIARTIQCSVPNDFLAVLDGLDGAQQDHVLIVNTLDSSRAVAGELFCAEAARRGVVGIVVDGPMRDTKYLRDFPNVRCFAKQITPYSGTVQNLGILQDPVNCGGVQVNPNDIIVGDDDGLVVGTPETFEMLVPLAREIQAAEKRIRQEIGKGKSLHSMTNYVEHVEAIRKGEVSALKFL
jgi:4-hydroxy-4-methyl-2-oxoglutarate aldolase